MQQRSIVRIGVPLAVAALALSACGSRATTSTGSSSGSASKTVKIGVIAPLSGSLSALGLGIQHSVELAVKQANATNAIPGWKIEVVFKDDEAKADVGKNAATQLAGDDSVVGVVGDLNSSVSQQTQPIFNSAKITQISPANTNPSLTIGADAANPKRQYAAYFRTCTTDAVQGPFAAQYLIAKGIKKVATVHDKQTYGQGLVEAFTKEFTKDGGTITDAETITTADNGGNNDFSTVITKIKPGAPQAIYYGGQFPEAGPLSLQVKNAALTIPLMGGDGIYDPKFIQLAGGKDEGDLATSVGAPADASDAGKKFLADYKAAAYPDESGAYGGYAYDAANAIINALKTSLASASDPKSARQATIDAVSKVSFDGVTGKVAFDQYGDATSKVITVYKVEGGKWVADKTDTFK
ncbi:branched-chain amino acid ABC transporter substrate-binding protein [Lapillicoccus sp.]|uniref:branched-chain amino acid ABC transporter substrate-binding protein n=1 Tax=Lapillicoccus sp. TaxID=1909287 RepID=UPI0025F9C214|nr:branched-chain amino acid ABC transporter substrate-binding protein [Lapillicoccus sp.]